jgi:hypothetical protein
MKPNLRSLSSIPAIVLINLVRATISTVLLLPSPLQVLQQIVVRLIRPFQIP